MFKVCNNRNSYMNLFKYCLYCYSSLTMLECWINDGAKECRHNNDGVKPVRERRHDRHVTKTILSDKMLWTTKTQTRKDAEKHKATKRASSPVPKLMSCKEQTRLGGIELENDLQHIKSQKTPLSIWNHRVLLIQTNKHSIDQNNHIIDIYKHSETQDTKGQMMRRIKQKWLFVNGQSQLS